MGLGEESCIALQRYSVPEDRRELFSNVILNLLLEGEAEAAEKQVEDSGDPLITRWIGRREYKLRKSVWKVIDERTKEKLEEKIESLERVMSEEEYLKLLYKYRKWLEAGGGR